MSNALEKPVKHRRPVLRFVLIFGILMGAFYLVWIVSTQTGKESDVFNGYLRANASASSFLLRLLGESARADGVVLASPRATLEIRAGCDALEPIGLFAAGVFALATTWRAKAIGLILGLGAIALLNQVRIISLYYIRIHWPTWFETMHVDVWQFAFIVFSAGSWTVWALWATRVPKPDMAHVPA